MASAAEKKTTRRRAGKPNQAAGVDDDMLDAAGTGSPAGEDGDDVEVVAPAEPAPADQPEAGPIEDLSEPPELIEAPRGPDLRPADEVIAELRKAHKFTEEQAAIAYRLRHAYGCPETRLESYPQIAIRTDEATEQRIRVPVTVVRCIECGESVMAKRKTA